MKNLYLFIQQIIIIVPSNHFSNQSMRNGVIYHCYQNTKGGELLFYTPSDYLIGFTILCEVTRKHPGIRLLKACLMPDHFHLSVIAQSKESLSAFMREYDTTLMHELNVISNGHGARLNTPFGRAAKLGDKKIRTHFIYLDNNPVERRSVRLAEEYRWNFLAYGESKHPYSDKIVLSRASRPLRRAVSMIRYRADHGLFMKYQILQKLAAPLNKQEREQWIDYIVSYYSVLDYQYVYRYFDNNYDKMLLAIHSNTGSEYDICEQHLGKTDIYYAKMIRLIQQRYALDDIHQMLSWSLPIKKEAYHYLLARCEAYPKQIAAFLHMEAVAAK